MFTLDPLLGKKVDIDLPPSRSTQSQSAVQQEEIDILEAGDEDDEVFGAGVDVTSTPKYATPETRREKERTPMQSDVETSFHTPGVEGEVPDFTYDGG